MFSLLSHPHPLLNLNKYKGWVKKPVTPQNFLFRLLNFLLISFYSILFPYTREEKWVSNLLWRCQRTQIFEVFVLGRSLEKVYIHGDNCFGNCNFYVWLFNFISFLDCVDLFSSRKNLYQIKKCQWNMEYKKCSSSCFLRLKIVNFTKIQRILETQWIWWMKK